MALEPRIIRATCPFCSTDTTHVVTWVGGGDRDPAGVAEQLDAMAARAAVTPEEVCCRRHRRAANEAADARRSWEPRDRR